MSSNLAAVFSSSSGLTLASVVSSIIGIINTIIPVLATLALVIFLWSGVRYIMTAEETKGKGPQRDALLWGLIALFVLFSIWGILGILQNTLLGNTTGGSGPATGAPLNIVPTSQ